MSNRGVMPGGEVTRWSVKGLGLVVGAAALIASMAVSATPTLADTYSTSPNDTLLDLYAKGDVNACPSFGDVPGTTGCNQRRIYNIVVPDNFTVGSLRVRLNTFAGAVQKTDYIIVSPSGTQVYLIEWACRQIPIALGIRNYFNGSDPDAQTNRNGVPELPRWFEDGGSGEVQGTPQWYTFADDGAFLGTTAAATGSDRVGACFDRWDGGLPDWPGLASEGWQPSGSFATLPTGATYQPSSTLRQNALADFSGEPAQGTWQLIVDDYRLPSVSVGPTIVGAVQLIFDNESVAPKAQAMVQNFMAARNSGLVSEDLQLENLIRKPKSTNISELASRSNLRALAASGLGAARGNIALNARQDLEQLGLGKRLGVWGRLSGHHRTTPTGDSKHLVGHAGFNFRASEKIALGLILTMDDAELKEGDGPAWVNGTGWLAGGYIVAKEPDGLTFTGRVQWGKSSNTIGGITNSDGTPFNSTDFDTDRFLVRAKLSGEYAVGPWFVQPQAMFSYARDTMTSQALLVSSSSTVSDTVSIDSVSVSEGRLEFGPRLGHRARRDGFSFEASVQVTGVFQFDPADYVDPYTIESGSLHDAQSDRLFARISGELGVRFLSGTRIDINGYYTGIGANEEGYGGSAKVKVPF